MNEENSIPALTLDPMPAETAAAVQEAPQEEVQEEAVTPKNYEMDSLSPAEQAAVRSFAEKIDVMNTEQVMHYGSNAQKNISDFSGAALASGGCSRSPPRASRNSRHPTTRQRPMWTTSSVPSKSTRSR